jgi:hypothetical protein
MILEGIYRRFIPLKGGKGQLDVRLTHLESVAMAHIEPDHYELARAGRLFSIAYNGTAPTGIAPVQAFPTTTAQWVLWNGDSIKSYALVMVGALLFSGTKGLGGTLLGTIFSAPAQTGFATGLTVANHSGSAIGSKAFVKSSVTITTPSAPNWFAMGEDILAVATIGPANAIINRLAVGSIVIPPLSGLGYAVLAPAGTTPLYLPLADWVEVESDLE